MEANLEVIEKLMPAQHRRAARSIPPEGRKQECDSAGMTLWSS